MLRKTAREFSEDQCTDLAYYAMLSLFPSLLVMVSLLGVFGQGQRTAEDVLFVVPANQEWYC